MDQPLTYSQKRALSRRKTLSSEPAPDRPVFVPTAEELETLEYKIAYRTEFHPLSYEILPDVKSKAAVESAGLIRWAP